MQWENVESGVYSSIEGMDPNAEWLLGPGHVPFTRGVEEAPVPFIISLLSEEALSIFDPAIIGKGVKPMAGFLMPWIYRDREVKVGDNIAAFAPRSFFETLARSADPVFTKLRCAKKRIELSLPLKTYSMPSEPLDSLTEPPVWRPNGRWPKGTVVIGVIDDGIAFAHERFRTANGETRVQFFWQQDGQFEPAGSTVDFGREIWKADLGTRRGIDTLLHDCDEAGLVDEGRLYREAQLVDFAPPEPVHQAGAWNLAHGTHVLDLAGGFDSTAAPLTKPIIAVQLPVATTADTSGSSLDFYVKTAVDYILRRAELLAGPGNPPLPVVINFSYGTIAGPHDGTSGLEISIDKSIADRGAPLSLILPAGNNHLSRCHAALNFIESKDATDTKDTISLNWRVQPDDMTTTQMEIWMPWDGGSRPQQSRVTIRVETPGGLLSGPLGEVHGRGFRLIDGNDVLAEARYHFVPGPTERGVFEIFMQPTARFHPPEPPLFATATAPSGLWKVHVSNGHLTPEQTVQAWIQRDDVIYGYPRRARQSYFDVYCYVRFNPVTGDVVKWDYEEDAENEKEGLRVLPCHVKRRGLLNAIATGCETTVVGGVYGKELTVVEYSAGGPITPTRGIHLNRLGPDALAVSDDSKVHRGVIAAGSRSGSAVAMNGTSVSAPQTTRKVACMLADPTKSGNRDAVRHAAAAEEAATRGGRPALQPEIRTGKGRIISARPDRPTRLDPNF